MSRGGVFQSAPRHLFRLSLLVLCGVTFQYGGVEAYMVGDNPYRRVEMLDPQGNYRLEWEVNRSTSRIRFNVTVATRGYIGFGLSAKGKMSGADIVIGGVLPNGKSYFSDRHAVANQIPEVDPSQDWDLHEARENQTHTFLSFSRAFDTCDPQDYPILEDKVSLIWAYGERDDELEYHHGNRGEFPVLLINPDYTPQIERDPKTSAPSVIHNPYNEDVRVWTWNVPFVMPASDTTYFCTINKGPNLPRKHHMIGFDVRFTDAISRRHLHHVIISKCHAPRGFNDRAMFEQYLNQGQICYGAGGRSNDVQGFTGPIPLEYCTDYLHMTAVGDRINFFPPHVGNPFGETRDEYYMIQMHYDNPEERTGIRVDVNLDIYYTPQLRKNEGDLFVVRHESPGLPPSHVIPPSSVNQKTYAICGEECSRKILPPEGIRIHTLLLHSHNSGVGMRFRHFRGNQELPFIATEDNFSFDYQQMRVLPREAHILPGDQVVIECLTDNTWANGTVVGGFSTRQEMCAAWFFYYNRLPTNMICASEINSPQFREYFLGVQNVSWSNTFIEYVVDSPRRFAGLPVSQVSDMIDWTVGKREELQRFQLTHPHTNRCPTELFGRPHTTNANGEPQDLDPGDNVGHLSPFPHNAKPYNPPQTCSMEGSNDSSGTNRRSKHDSGPGPARGGNKNSHWEHDTPRGRGKPGRWRID